MNNIKDLQVKHANESINSIENAFPVLFKCLKKLNDDQKCRYIGTEFAQYNGLEKQYMLKLTAKEGYRSRIDILKEVESSTGKAFLKYVEVTEEEAINSMVVLLLNNQRDQIENMYKSIQEFHKDIKEVLDNL